MKQLNTKIIHNKKITPHHYKMRLESGHLAKHSNPGQFVEVRCSHHPDPLLRRPLGVHRILPDGIEILYEIVGRGTELLSLKKAGEVLDVIGPLGNGFGIRSTGDGSQSRVLVAGGIGVAPLLALAEKVAYSVERTADRKKIKVFIGAKTASHILCAEEFKKLGCKVYVATENGSKGHKGLITDLLDGFLQSMINDQRLTINERRTTIYACGPTGMLKAVAGIAGRHDIPCQVSLEERMACGVGVCLGCPVKIRSAHTINDGRSTINEYKMVCKDGPVFDAESIVW